MREQLNQVMSNRVATSAFVGVVSFGLGAGVGYFISKRRIESLMFDVMTNTSDSTPHTTTFDPEEYTVVYFDSNRDEEVEETADQEAEVEPEAEVVSIFATEKQDDWDEEAEMLSRIAGQPYVISYEEFVTSENLRQSTLTYYAGDEVLVDEKDLPIYNKSEVVGDLRFGHGSTDANIVYIRNDRLRAEYEVIRDPGHYAEEILGNTIEQGYEEHDLKHSRLKFRDTED